MVLRFCRSMLPHPSDLNGSLCNVIWKVSSCAHQPSSWLWVWVLLFGDTVYVYIYSHSSGESVWTVVQTVLTATFNSYGNRQISTPHNSTPLVTCIVNDGLLLCMFGIALTRPCLVSAMPNMHKTLLQFTCLDKIVCYLQRIFNRNRKLKQQVSK